MFSVNDIIEKKEVMFYFYILQRWICFLLLVTGVVIYCLLSREPYYIVNPLAEVIPQTLMYFYSPFLSVK